MLFWITVLSGLWLVYWYKATRVPKNFPPGPRYPLPVLGDLHLLGSNLQNGLRCGEKTPYVSPTKNKEKIFPNLAE